MAKPDSKKKKASPKKKVIKKKPVKKKVAARKPKPAAKKPVQVKAKVAAKKKKEGLIGEITHYFPKVRAAVVKLKAPLLRGDKIKIKGHTTDFTQAVNSLQIDHVSVEKAGKGDEIGLLVDSRVRQNDLVYKA